MSFPDLNLCKLHNRYNNTFLKKGEWSLELTQQMPQDMKARNDCQCERFKGHNQTQQSPTMAPLTNGPHDPERGPTTANPISLPSSFSDSLRKIDLNNLRHPRSDLQPYRGEKCRTRRLRWTT